MANAEIPRLSEEARELLLEAVQDSEGLITVTESFDGVSVETNWREFTEEDDPRSGARWKRVVGELRGEELIAPAGSESFRVTDRGYDVADGLIRG